MWVRVPRREERGVLGAVGGWVGWGEVGGERERVGWGVVGRGGWVGGEGDGGVWG